MEEVREALSDSIDLPDPTLRVFRGERRAIGEVLLTRTDNLDEHRARLVALQHALLKLIDLLDPDGDRVSAQLRQPL